MLDNSAPQKASPANATGDTNESASANPTDSATPTVPTVPTDPVTTANPTTSAAPANLAAPSDTPASADASPTDPASDPVFQQEQAHLSETYAALLDIARTAAARIERARLEAADDKRAMSEELAPNFDTADDTIESYAEFSVMNHVIDSYNLSQDANTRKLADAQLLLKQPYFAKIELQFKPGQPSKALYLGNAGMSDGACRRLVVDWRSPVAEVYYNQVSGPTSYVANGRTIHADLKTRRQFDLEADTLHAYFDTSVAIQDALLLASLSNQRSERMQAITATIQKEQNVVVRHDDVEVLLVDGIAGSGKTSVMMQRIAYLFYQRRDNLDPREIFLLTPNDVFGRYIAHVLPDLGESNPQTFTWDTFARSLMPSAQSQGDAQVPPETLWQIDAAADGFQFEPGDFRDIAYDGVRFVSAAQIRTLAGKYAHLNAAPHRIALMREELLKRTESRLAQMAGNEDVQYELASLSIDKQLAILGEVYDPQNEDEARELCARWLQRRFAPVKHMVAEDRWLRIDRIGMRILNAKSLAPVTWLYVRIALCGLCNAQAKYVMIDEVQDYTIAQLAVLARYFRRAHFMLLGDEHQAIKEGTASFCQVEALFERLRGPVHRCSLMTSYRSAPAITSLFSGLLEADERLRVECVQRDDQPARIEAFDDETAYAHALTQAIEQVQGSGEGLGAIIVPWKNEERRLRKLLGDALPALIDERGSLPHTGVVVTTLALAKGLEFDHVIIPNANAYLFPDEPLARCRLYTTISRATRSISIFALGELSPLL